MFRRKLAFLDGALQLVVVFGVVGDVVEIDLGSLQDLLQFCLVLVGRGVHGLGHGLGHLHLVGISWFQAGQPQAKAGGGHQWIDDRIVVVSVVIRQPYRDVPRLVFRVKNIERAGPVFGRKDLDGTVEELAASLYFWIVSVDAVLAGAGNVM